MMKALGRRDVAGDEGLRHADGAQLGLHHARQTICACHEGYGYVAAADIFQIILGGGQDAMSVTTTGSRQGKFEALFWHKLFEEEIGRVKGHL